MADDPTPHDAEPAAAPVSDHPREVGQDDLGANVADYAEGVAEAILTDTSLDEATPEFGQASTLRLEAPVRPATKKRSGKEVEASPLLSMPRVKDPQAIALFLHGGDVTSNVPARRGDPAYLRMVPFARDVERRSRKKVGSAVLRLSMRGWNDPDLPAIEDTKWALRLLQKRYPGLPIALIGHSMGGRVVLHLGDSAEVEALVGLAPWASDKYPAEDFARTPVLIVHGRQDTVTDPKASEDLVQRIDSMGGTARFISMPGWHAMLWRAQEWHKITSTFLIEQLLPGLHRA